MSDHLPIVMDIKFDQTFLNIESFEAESIITFNQGNIFRNELNVKMHSDYLSKIDKLYIYNTLGQQVKVVNVYTSEIKVSLEDLPDGIYLLKAPNVNTKKFVISR